MTGFIRILSILFACSAVSMATPAQSQLAPGRSGSSTLQYMGQVEAMALLATWGRCYAKRQRAESLSLIATRPTSIEEAQVYRKLFRRDGIECLSGESLSAPLAYVRGAVAEGLLLAGLGVPAEFLQPAPARAEVRNLSDAARCYVAGHREQARAVLTTRAGTKEEYAALSPLIDAFAACLPPGVEARFDPTVIRFRLAEALLRLDPTAPAIASGSSK